MVESQSHGQSSRDQEGAGTGQRQVCTFLDGQREFS